MPPNNQVEPLSLGDGGKREILYDNHFYDVTSWIKRHPGGNIIQFYTEPGEDATLAIEQFHYRFIDRTLSLMKGLPKRQASPEELGVNLPTIQRHKAITKDFHKLDTDLKAEGFFKASPSHALLRLLDLFLLAFVGVYLMHSSYLLLQLVGIVIFALYFGRCGYIMHETGHNSITGYPKMDRFILSFVSGFCTGASGNYWANKHNRHHAMTNRLQHDVDLKTLPLLAFNKKVVSKPEDGVGFFVRHQSKLFIGFDSILIAIAWKLYLHPRYAIRKRYYLDLVFMIAHYIGIYTFGISMLQYLAIVWLGSHYLLLNINLSHSHLPVTNEKMHWVEYALHHTTDLEPSWWCDYWMGYLNYQIEHHLFPAMPAYRGREFRKRVKALAEKHNLPYHTMTYWDAVKRTYENLENVSQELQNDNYRTK